MPVPWDEQKTTAAVEWSQPELSDTEGKAGEETQALWRSAKDHVWILGIGTRNCNTEATLETPRSLGCQSCGLPAQENCFQGIKQAKEKELCCSE